MTTQSATLMVSGVARARKKELIPLSLKIFLLVVLLAPADWVLAHDDCGFDRFTRNVVQTPACRREGGRCFGRIRGQYAVALCEGLPDAVIQATWSTTGPISSFPTIRTFVPTGTWIIEGVDPSGPIMTTPLGSMTIQFVQDPDFAPDVVATIQEFSITIPTSPVGQITAGLLQQDLPFIKTTTTSGDFDRLITTSSSLRIDPASGLTEGAVGTFNSTADVPFTYKGLIAGNLDFANGTWSWNVEGLQSPIPEPSSLVVFGTGAILGFHRFKLWGTKVNRRV